MPYSHHHSLRPSQPTGEESHPTPGSFHGSFKNKRKDSTATSWLTSFTPTHRVPKFWLAATCLFYLIEECIHHFIKKSVTSFRKPLEVGLKLAITLRHLATGETYTSLQNHWLVGPTTICKFILQVCRAILAEFQNEYLHCPDTPDEWKRVDGKFRTRWNVPQAVGSLDGKHITIKKPKKTGSDYYKYKGFFSIVLLALWLLWLLKCLWHRCCT